MQRIRLPEAVNDCPSYLLFSTVVLISNALPDFLKPGNGHAKDVFELAEGASRQFDIFSL
jgi:hypothetical protein